METAAIDRLYLELSQFTKAKTAREINLERRVQALRDALEGIVGVKSPQEAEEMRAGLLANPGDQEEKDTALTAVRVLIDEYAEDKAVRARSVMAQQG